MIMMKTSTFKTQFKRKQAGKTNYKKRLAFLKSGTPRLVIRKSNNNVIAEVIEFRDGKDWVKANASALELKKFNWNYHTGNLPSAYLTGFLAGKKAAKNGVTVAILDIGLNTPIHGSRVFTALKGAVDAGLQISCDASAFPSEDRISGKHIADYSAKLEKEDKAKHDRVFSSYVKAKQDPKKMVEHFNLAKKTIEQAQFKQAEEKKVKAEDKKMKPENKDKKVGK